MADNQISVLPSNVLEAARAASAGMGNSIKSSLRYIPDDVAEGLTPEYRQSLKDREAVSDNWAKNLPPAASADYKMSKENLDGTNEFLKKDEIQAADLVYANRLVAKKLGDVPLPVEINDKESGMFSSNANYSGTKSSISVNQMDLERYGSNSDAVKGSLAHEYGHSEWDKKGMQGTRVGEELYADSTVAKTCDPKIVTAYKNMLAQDYAGMPPDHIPADGVHPSLNMRNLTLDKAYSESCANIAAPLPTSGPNSGPSLLSK